MDRIMPTFGRTKKTVADVTAGLARIVSDLKDVIEANVERRTEAEQKIAAANAELATANDEIAAANTVINNITALLGGGSNVVRLQAAE